MPRRDLLLAQDPSYQAEQARNGMREWLGGVDDQQQLEQEQQLRGILHEQQAKGKGI